MDQAAQLLHRIQRRYQTIADTVSIAGITFPFVRVADPNVVLDQVAAAEDQHEKLHGPRPPSDQLHLPYWAEVWDSATGVGEMLLRYPADTSVLDLGCGMGLAGTVAARLGMRVTFADLEADALLFARLNTLPDAPRVRTHRLDWRRDRLEERFDLILGADILYEIRQWEHLEPFWRAHLKAGGEILLGEPGRQTGDRFESWITAKNWQLATESVRVPTRSTPIRVFKLRQHP